MSGGALSIGAALLLGLAASGHCLVMCGGITAALGTVTARRIDGRRRVDLLVGYQFGRVLSYTLAGFLFSGVAGAAISWLDNDRVRIALRTATAGAFVIGGLVAFGVSRHPGAGVAHKIWSRIAPIGRRLLPVSSFARATAFGMLWGWMPCGFVYTVLLVATLSLDSMRGAATMAAFGVGTVPVLLLGALGTQQIALGNAPRFLRSAAGSLLLASAMLTLAGPWLTGHAPWLHALLPFDCVVPVP